MRKAIRGMHDVSLCLPIQMVERAQTIEGKLATLNELPYIGTAFALIAITAAAQRNRVSYPAAGETRAIRVSPGSRTIKCTLGPLPDRSGANSIMMPNHAVTRACNASSACSQQPSTQMMQADVATARDGEASG